MSPTPEHTAPPVLLEPEALRAARNVYRDYHQGGKHLGKPLLGVAVNSDTYHTTLIFSAKPVLLPREFFVPRQLLN
ncbi:hypothetical protein [Synechococcus sp. C9]|jgi:hypothetical protein|uniref:hypothetical protein n=1 Tax=Synechococcus sp. C9 TaxID=102119 RepID=UPI001FF69125|nr:hypothetical protein [Synechococcus sp. C9]